MLLTIKNLIEKYKTFLKYIISAGLSFGIDLALFTVFVALLKPIMGDISIFVATLCARVISSFFNYLINRNAVFKSNNNKESKVDTKTLVKYYILVVIQMCVSSVLVFGFHKITTINETIVKIPVDVIIFIVNYFVQKLYIFKK